MKIRIIIATILFFTGIAPMIDWWIFCAKPEFKNLEWTAFKAAYISHFPQTIRPLFASAAATWISIIILTIAGLLYFRTPYKSLKVVAIISFILAFWNLFSLM